MPVGNLRVLATHGIGTIAQTAMRKTQGGRSTETIEIEMPQPLWNPASGLVFG